MSDSNADVTFSQQFLLAIIHSSTSYQFPTKTISSPISNDDDKSILFSTLTIYEEIYYTLGINTVATIAYLHSKILLYILWRWLWWCRPSIA